jgi:hypothetical protein
MQDSLGSFQPQEDDALREERRSSFVYGNGDTSILRNRPGQRRSPQEASFGSLLNGHQGQTVDDLESRVEPQPQHSGFRANLISPFGTQATGAGHAHRPSVHSTQSFPQQTVNQRAHGMNAQLSEEVLQQRFGSLGIGDRPSSSATNGDLDFSSPSSRPFQFNPGSQSFSGSHGAGSRMSEPKLPVSDYSFDSLQDTFPAYLPNRRPSAADRGHTPAALFRSNGAGAFENGIDGGILWSRPASRDSRSLSELERRMAASTVSQQHYVNPSLYNPNYTHQYSQQPMLDTFATQHYPPALLPPGFTTQTPPYVSQGAMGLPNRNVGDRDVGKGMRSTVLDNFRLSTRSGAGARRYELRVRQRDGDKGEEV